jgi:dinuclear metal center YbgI/SA1388 family protein
MTIGDFLRVLERDLPPGTAVDRDPVGLHVGDPGTILTGVLVAHEVDVRMVDEAVIRGANLVISYHPLIFQPLRSVSRRDPVGAAVTRLIRAGVALYVVHTALDVHPHGPSKLLADALGLEHSSVLAPAREALTKIVTFVPAHDAERVSEAMWSAGAGRIGGYDECSFRTAGEGTFKGNEGTEPVQGKVGRRERVDEMRVEMVVPRWALGSTIGALLGAHPYEEPAYDVVPLLTANADRGMGTIGDLRKSVTLGAFLRSVKKVTHAEGVRANATAARKIRRVAIVSGSGSSYIEDALRAGADTILTGDLRYHTMREWSGRLVLIDAGHIETEMFVLDALFNAVRAVSRSGNLLHIRVARATKRTSVILHA